jgi:hypothetical protein
MVVLAIELDDHAVVGPVGVDKYAVEPDVDEGRRDIPPLAPDEEVVF